MSIPFLENIYLSLIKQANLISKMTTSLQTRVFYGLKTDIISNAHYITDSEVLYPVGNVITVHNVPQSRQRFLHLADKTEINIISVAPNK